MFFLPPMVAFADTDKSLAGPLATTSSNINPVADGPLAAIDGLSASDDTLKRKQSEAQAESSESYELVDKRDAKTQVFRNSDGSMTERQYFGSKFYNKDGSWQEIDTTLAEDKNAADSGFFGRVFGKVQTWFKDETTFQTVNNGWTVRFAPANDEVDMVRIAQNGQTVSFSPHDARDVKPVVASEF